MVVSPLYFKKKGVLLRALNAAVFLSAFAILFFEPHLAFATGTTTLGQVLCSVVNNMGPLINFFDMLAYTAGVFVCATGIHSLARHAEAPGQTPLPQGIYRLVGGACLLSLPSVASMVIETLFTDPGSNGLTACTPGKVDPLAASATLDVIMTNFVSNIQGPLINLLSVICEVLGVYLIYQGLLKSSRYGTDPRANSPTTIISSLTFGAIFMVIGQSLDTIMLSVFGDSSIHTFSSLKWTSLSSMGGDTTQFQNAIKAALTFFQLVGFISFVRGFNVLRNAVEGKGQATVGQGLTHIIGGVLAINIYYFMQIMDQTFGTNFVT